MEENMNVGEQPKNIEPSQNFEENVVGSPEQVLQESESATISSEAERGVPIGKFKSVDDLFEAYNNLQAEFTRKSQRLSELEKDKMSETSQDNVIENKFQTFLSKNQEAAVYADEIKSRAMQSESLKNDDACFDIVWAEMLYEKLSGPNKAKEPIVQNLVLKDEELKNLVIENYMKQLQEQKTPVIMSSNSGERVTKTVTPKPDSFEQAKKIVLDLLS